MRTICWGSFTGDGEMFHIVRSRMPAPYPLPLHRHEGFAECFLVESGSLWHRCTRRKVLLQEGDLALIRPRDTHTLKAAGAGAVFTNVAFPTEILRDLQRRYPDESGPALWDFATPLPVVVQLDADLSARMRSRLDVLARAPRSRFEIERFLINLFYDLRVQPFTAEARSLPPWLQRACREIHKPTALRAGLPAFMRLAGRSPEHVARTLKRYTGQTPTGIVNQARLAEAARRFCMTDEAIIDVAAACGFENLSYFYRLFRQRYGLSPRRYRLLNHCLFSSQT